MKKCSECGETKPRGEFHKHARARDGLDYRCKACAKTRNKTYTHPIPAPPDDELSTTFKTCSTCGESLPLTEFNKHKRLSYGRHNQCRSCSNAASLKWQKDFPDRDAANTALRHARKKNCCPFWIKGKHRKEIQLLYTEAQEKKRLTGIEYHVDHIVPIGNQQIYKSLVCGLHVPWNLQVLTAEENMKKSDNFTLWDED